RAHWTRRCDCTAASCARARCCRTSPPRRGTGERHSQNGSPVSRGWRGGMAACENQVRPRMVFLDRGFRQVFVLLVIGCLPGCSGVTNPSQNKTETITGTVTKGFGSINASFNITKTGEFTVTVTNLSPSAPTNLTFTVAVYQGGCGGVL